MKESNNQVLKKGEIERLKTEFDQSQTIKHKYNLRKKILKLCYDGYQISQASVDGFEVKANTPDEVEQLNRLLYSDYVNGGNNNERSPEEWRELFLQKIETAYNKEFVVANELEKLDNLTNKNNASFSSHSQRPDNSKSVVPYLNTDENFCNGYENYISNEKEDIDWSEKNYKPYEIARIFNGIEWAKYREFVKNYNTKETNTPEIKLTGEEKFLVLHYLGFGNEVKANTKKSNLYDLFIDELNYKSIRPMFSDIRKYETEKNLNTIIDFFRFIKLDSKAREIKDKLDKMHKKK